MYSATHEEGDVRTFGASSSVWMLLFMMWLGAGAGCSDVPGDDDDASSPTEIPGGETPTATAPPAQTPTLEAGTPTPEAGTPTPEPETPTPEPETPTPEAATPTPNPATPTIPPATPTTSPATPTPPADDDLDGVAAANDCDDSNPLAYPGADERCDEADNDCDGTIDEDAEDASTFYQDLDGDTYGNPEVATKACAAPDGYVVDGQDCDDTDATRNPETLWYLDTDEDGYGLESHTLEQCEQPGVFYARESGDCDDADPDYHPGADGEDCSDPNDYNCDGAVDWADADGDGSADCVDCDDENEGIFPGALEVCDGVDNDCDGAVDDADDVDGTSVWYLDTDGDAYGSSDDTVKACEQPKGYAANNGDCDDEDPDVNPGATEVCELDGSPGQGKRLEDSAPYEGIDNDCDGLVDEADPSLEGAPSWYIDYDGDGYGSDRYVDEACTAPEGFVPNVDDCDDTDADSNPEATEVCDRKDNNCDGTTDEDTATDAGLWYEDVDEDGFGDEDSPRTACYQPQGYVAAAEHVFDCDDTDERINPAAEEACDGLDNDCDGEADTGADGLEPLCAVLDCVDLASANPNADDGLYWIDPASSGEPFQVHCDMSTSGGGWSLVATLSNVDGSRSWSETTPIFSAWLDNETLVATNADLESDFKSRAYGDLQGNDLMIMTDKGVWGVWNGLSGLSLMERIALEAGGCNAWTDSAAILTIQSYSVSALNRSLVINAVDGNASGHCPFGHSGDFASDSAVLSFSDTSAYGGPSSGAGLQGIGQSWETNIKNTRLPVVHCTSIDCYEDFVSAYAWEQSGNDDQFIATVLNTGEASLEPDIVWLYVR